VGARGPRRLTGFSSAVAAELARIIATIRRVLVAIEASDLPGRRCGPSPEGGSYENIHVGLCDRSWKGTPVVRPDRPWGVTGLVAGDAAHASWELDIAVKHVDGSLDFTGRAVRGKRGDRHIGLAWGEMPDAETFVLFRGAKLRLDAIEAAVVQAAARPGKRLVGRLGLTDAKGHPRCASVRPPEIVWTAEPIET
jgi:hypothetical protein